MPDPRDNAKKTGDTHEPEVESELPFQEGMTDAIGADGTPRDRGKASERVPEGRRGRGIRKAGVLKDQDQQPKDPAAGGDTTDESGRR